MMKGALSGQLFHPAVAVGADGGRGAFEELIGIAAEKSGYIRAMWCGELECELALKEKADVTSRCMPFNAEPVGDTCVCCGKPAKTLVYWGKAY